MTSHPWREHAGLLAAHRVPEDYLAALTAAGLDDLPVDSVVAFAANGVEPALVQQLRAQGDLPAVHEVLGLALNGITAGYLRELADGGVHDLSTADLIALGANRVPAADVVAYRASGWQLSAPEIGGLALNGVRPDDLAELSRAGLSDVPAGDLLTLAGNGVPVTVLVELHRRGARQLSVHEVVALARSGAATGAAEPSAQAALAAVGLTYDDIRDLVEDLPEDGTGQTGDVEGAGR